MKTKSVPFDRPRPIPAPNKDAELYGFSLSMDSGPTFLVPVRLRGMFLICPVFANESDGWKEAAYRAVKGGRDPSPYVEKVAPSKS
jgi:hypothetical protein